MDSCIFCQIIAGEIPAERVHEDQWCMAIKDINPKARVHLLVIPNKHIQSLAHLSPEDEELMGHLTLQIPKIAAEAGLDNGFRTVVNTGPGGGQVVGHIHYHILGGGPLPMLSDL